MSGGAYDWVLAAVALAVLLGVGYLCLRPAVAGPLGAMSRFVTGRPYGCLGLVYLGAVLAIWDLFWPAVPPQGSYLAETSLAYNHRIAEGDLKKPDVFPEYFGFYMPAEAAIIGKYVTAQTGVAAGDKIDRKHLSAHPDLTIDPGSVVVPLAFPADSHLLGLIEVGTKLTLLAAGGTGGPVFVPAKVHAIICEPGKDDEKSCTPLLEFPAGDLDLVTKNTAALRFVLDSAPSAAPVEKK